MAVVLKTVLGSYFGPGKFTAHLVSDFSGGLNWMFTGYDLVRQWGFIEPPLFT